MDYKKILVFIVGALGVAFANALVVQANIANTAWGIAAMNIDAYTDAISFGFAMSYLNIFVFILCRIVERKFRIIKDTIGLILSFFFGVAIEFFQKTIYFIPTDSIVTRYILLVFGIVLMTYTIVVYLKSDVFKFPFDDSIVIFANGFFNGKVAFGSYLGMAIAAIIALGFGLASGTIIGFNIQTVVISIAFGPLIGFFFKHTNWVDKIISEKE